MTGEGKRGYWLMSCQHPPTGPRSRCMEPAGGLPEEFLNRVKSDVEKWKNVVKQAKIVIAQ